MFASILFSYNIELFSFRNCIVGSTTNISNVTSEGSHLSGGILLPLDPGDYLGLDLGRGQVQAQVLAGTRPIERVRTSPSSLP